MRKIVIAGELWMVKVGKDSMEARTGPRRGGIKLVIPLTFATGNTSDNIERGRWKKTADGMVTPGMIAEAIQRCLQTSRERQSAVCNTKSRKLERLPLGGDWVITDGRSVKNWRMSRT